MNELAQIIHDYIRDRAAVEGVGFSLPFSIFTAAVSRGAKVFGVVHDGQRMLFDEQEPFEGYLQQWLRRSSQLTK